MFPDVTFNPEISYGAVFTVISVLFMGIGVYYQNFYDNKRFKSDIGDIKIDLKILNKLVTDIALQNQRLDNQGERLNRLENHLDEMRHGKGFVE